MKEIRLTNISRIISSEKIRYDLKRERNCCVISNERMIAGRDPFIVSISHFSMTAAKDKLIYDSQIPKYGK